MRRKPPCQVEQSEVIAHRDARHSLEAINHHREQLAQGARVGFGHAVEIEAFFGQLYPAILIGRLVTLQMQEKG